MGNIKKQLVSSAIEPQILLLEAPIVVPEEVDTILDDYSDFGIKNKTSEYLKTRKREVREINDNLKRKSLTIQGTNALLEAFFPYKIVTYGVIHQVAQDHNLVISSLSFYNELIEKENVNELKMFQEKMKEIVDTLESGKITFPKANTFTFDNHTTGIKELDFANYFNIVAPKSHFDWQGKNTLQIGKEIKPYHKKPGMNLDFKLNVPELSDPIIIAPMWFLKRLYCVVVTAWDEVADDLRIRQLI